MLETVLATKLFKPPVRPGAILRSGLSDRLEEAQKRGLALTLVSAPAGFGKSTLLSAWVDQRVRQFPKLRVAWISLDEGDSDPSQFLLYLAAALHGAEPSCGADAMAALQSPRPPSAESILTDLINEIDGATSEILLVLDDYHATRSTDVDAALAFLLEHLPARLRMVVATREDPALPLARLRARGELAELRAADLRFSTGEAADFLRRVMDLDLSAEDVAALEHRTEGWIAGLQLAGLSLRGQTDTAAFIRSFTGSHRFVLDYLAEEVLRRQPESIQAFLLRTSILDRFCGPLCDAVLQAESGQATLEYLERINLFIVPLDGERRWYRYHRLFGELLRQRLEQSLAAGPASLHLRASEWFERQGLLIEAFHHAAAASDVDRAERLISGSDMPLHFRGAVIPVLEWLTSLPAGVLDARPSLRLLTATTSLAAGRTAGVEEALNAVERSVQHAEPGEATRDFVGRIAAARSTLALTRYQPEEIEVQARRALEHLRPDNLRARFTAMWTMAFAHLFRGDRATASRTYADLLSRSDAAGDAFFTQLALCGLGQVQELDNRLHLAAETYRRALRSFGEHPNPNANEPHLGLARIAYEWNDLDAAEEHGERGLQLARQYDVTIDRFILGEILLARVAAARGRLAVAAARLDKLASAAQAPGFRHRLPEIAAVQVRVLLLQGNVDAAARLAAAFDLPQERARVLLAQDDPSAALAAVEPLFARVEALGWQAELLGVKVLQAVAHHAQGEEDEAAQMLGDALVLAEREGFVRLFVDEGTRMAGLLSAAASRQVMPSCVARLLAAFSTTGELPATQPLFEPLSQRELEVLRLVAEGLSNQEICDRLFLALDTVKGHNRRIFEKLEVKRRTEAIARGRELGLL